MKEDVGTVELLPCPFCGASQDDFGGMVPEAFCRGATTFAHECGGCGAIGPFRGTMEEAITAWNARTPPTKGTSR